MIFKGDIDETAGAHKTAPGELEKAQTSDPSTTPHVATTETHNDDNNDNNNVIGVGDQDNHDDHNDHERDQAATTAAAERLRQRHVVAKIKHHK